MPISRWAGSGPPSAGVAASPSIWRRTSAGASSTALVTITITGQNDAPVAANLTGAVQEHGPATTVSAPYTDPDSGDTHSFSVDATGTLGKVTDNGNGPFSYDPNGAFASLNTTLLY